MSKNITLFKIGNSTGYLINDFKIKKLIINDLLKDVNKINFEEKIVNSNDIIKKIKENNYKVIDIVQGNNYILLLKEINNIYYTVLIKKNFNLDNINYNQLEIISVDIKFPKEYFKGSILEGRIEINNETEFKFFNIIKLKGNLIDYELKEKYLVIKDNFNNLNNKYFTFEIYNYYDIQDIKNSKGIIFLPNTLDIKYIIYFDNSIQKEYAKLYLKKINTDVFNLFSKEKKKIGIAHIPNIKTSHYFNKINDEVVVNCWYNFKFNKWVPFEIIEDISEITSINDLKIKTIKI